MKQQFKAVLFDLGGVIFEYKDPNKYTEVIKLVESLPELHECLVDFECGRTSIMEVKAEFLEMFGINHKDDFEKSAIRNSMERKNPFVVTAIESLHALGKYKLAVVTNNGFWDAQKTKSTFVEPDLPMDFLIESCKIGQRKPDAEFYQTVLDKIGMTAGECIFIDDLRANCLGAEAVGIKSIWLKDGNGQEAMEQLENILQEKLL